MPASFGLPSFAQPKGQDFVASVGFTPPSLGSHLNLQGQGFEANAVFTAQLPGSHVYLQRNGDAVFVPEDVANEGATSATGIWRLHFVGANANVRARGLAAGDGVADFVTVNRARNNGTAFDQVRFRNVYQGIDVVYRENQNHLEFVFLVHPGANPSKIRLAYHGADELQLDASGNLTLGMPGGTVAQKAPIAFQNTINGWQEVGIRPRLDANGQLRFQVGAYDRRRLLVIDPEINNPPQAINDSFSVVHDHSLFGNVLANDSDPDLDPLTVTSNTNPAHGTVTVATDGLMDYVPAAGFVGSDSFNYTISDGQATATATVSISVTNNVPSIDAIANQNSIEGRTVSLQITASDPDFDPLTYSATGLPPGLAINASSGLISGKLSYTSAGTHNVTITVTDNAGATGTRSFTWTVADATIGSLTATEMNGAIAQSNSVTATAVFTPTLWISQGNGVRLQVAPPAGVALPMLADILFSIQGYGANPGAGNFTAEPVISFTDSTEPRYVHVGIDSNGSGTLDVAEEMLEVEIDTIDFTGAELTSRRSGNGPVEPTGFAIKDAEHFEVGGKFEFEMKGGAHVPASKMRFDLIRFTGGIGQIEFLKSDSGTSFEYVFTAANAGSCFVRFYADKNGNSSWDVGEDWKGSAVFTVKAKKPYTISAEVSDKIGDGNAAALTAFVGSVPGLFTDAAELLLKKDSASDWRAAVSFSATAATFPATPAGGVAPDPVANAGEAAKLWDRASDVVFVRTLNEAAGWTNANDWHQILIAYMLNNAALAGTIAHEMGHGVGLNHPVPDNAARVMTVLWTGTANELTSVEATTFDS